MWELSGSLPVPFNFISYPLAVTSTAGPWIMFRFASFRCADENKTLVTRCGAGALSPCLRGLPLRESQRCACAVNGRVLT